MVIKGNYAQPLKNNKLSERFTETLISAGWLLIKLKRKCLWAGTDTVDEANVTDCISCCSKRLKVKLQQPEEEGGLRLIVAVKQS